MSYLVHILIMLCIYEILLVSLNLIVGYGGMLSMCHATFYALGAYVSALLMIGLGWPFGLSLSAAICFTGVFAYLVGIVSTRFHGDFFFLATLGFQVIANSILYNWKGLTGGSFGLSSIPAPSLFGWRLSSVYDHLFLSALLASVVVLVAWRLSTSAFCRTLQAVRDDELAAQSLGKPALRFKQVAFTVGGMLAAIAGGLYAGYVHYIDPTSFGVDESILMLAALVIGGVGNLRGPVIGAVIVVVLPEALRFLPISGAIAAGSRQIVYGLLLIVMMRLRPQGIAGRYAFD